MGDQAIWFDIPIWITVLRGTGIYLTLAVVLRLMPKRETGSISPNDMIGLVIVGNLAANAIAGAATSAADLMLLAAVVLAWSYILNLLEYYFPRWRTVAQDTPTLLIHNGEILKGNLRKEKLTEQELYANLRKNGVAHTSKVLQAVLEVDGQISVVQKQ